jgi:hypothetical protein
MILYYAILYLISLVVVICAFHFDWTYQIENFDKVLDSVITFSSIILGFLGALLGILITIRDSSIMIKIFKENHKSTIKHYFSESIFIGFLVVITSTILQLFLSETDSWILYLFYGWLFITTLFICSSYRVIRTLMDIMFKSDIKNEKNEKEIDDESQTQKEERKNRLAKRKSKKINEKQKVVNDD